MRWPQGRSIGISLFRRKRKRNFCATRMAGPGERVAAPVGQIARTRESVEGIIRMKAVSAADGLFKVQVRVNNLTLLDEDAGRTSRDTALMRSLVSTHIVLGALDGRFVSLLGPPEHLKDLAASCQNVGAWPVLVGAEGERDTVLSSPIILYDYP